MPLEKQKKKGRRKKRVYTEALTRSNSLQPLLDLSNQVLHMLGRTRPENETMSGILITWIIRIFKALQDGIDSHPAKIGRKQLLPLLLCPSGPVGVVPSLNLHLPAISLWRPKERYGRPGDFTYGIVVACFNQSIIRIVGD